LGRQVKVQFEGSDGERYTIKLEGSLSRDKVMRIMDMYELLAREEGSKPEAVEDTLYGKIQRLVDEKFTLKQFTSDQIRNSFEDIYNQPIKLAEVSTYLSRMNDQGIVNRRRRGRKWLYSLTPPTRVGTPQIIPRPRTRFNQIIDR
jgi:hypothetical protein